MPLGSGLAGQIGYAEETTYGTRVAPTRFLEFVEEGIEFAGGRDESQGIRAGTRVLRSDRWREGRRSAAGTVEHEVANKGFGMLFKHMFGAAPTITTPLGGVNTREHDYRLGDPAALSLTCQVGRPDTGGTVRPFDYLGAKVEGWTLSQELDDYLRLSLDLDARDEDTSQALAVASFPASQELFGWRNLVVNVGGAAFDVNTFELSGAPGIATERYFVGSALKKAPLPAALVEITGEMTGEFTDMTAYNRVKNATTAAITAFWTGTLIEGALSFAIEITMQVCRFDGGNPLIGGPEILEQPLSFKVLDDGTNPPIKLIYRTTDTAV